MSIAENSERAWPQRLRLEVLVVIRHRVYGTSVSNHTSDRQCRPYGTLTYHDFVHSPYIFLNKTIGFSPISEDTYRNNNYAAESHCLPVVQPTGMYRLWLLHRRCNSASSMSHCTSSIFDIRGRGQSFDRRPR